MKFKVIDLKPDIEFKRDLEKLSGASLSTCMQCGTCSVVCNLSPEEKPFPRKEMVYAGWGMKEKLIGNPDVWLCHQCGDCSTHCPRGVDPADVIAAVRLLTYRQYAVPRFMGKMVSRPSMLPVAILLPVIIITAIIFMAGTLEIPDGPVNYSKFFPHAWLNGSFTLLTLLSYGIASIGLARFWKDISMQYHADPGFKKGFFRSLWKVKNEILTHSRFSKCEQNRSRKISHFLVFYGFILLLLVTIYAIYAAVTGRYPLALTNPFKILGNLSSFMLLAGLGMMLFSRIKGGEELKRSTYPDWQLIVALLFLTISGVIIEAARFLDWSMAYYMYFFHLVCVWFVIIYLPYTKFGHIIYRTVAMTFAFSVGRNQGFSEDQEQHAVQKPILSSH
ncbi:MAG: quinone-interacting membrane-bound oxidoreductase complex subunit QmoC [Bacteroidales bacterium]|nr:quinone-interacting membrane-bound oxidoreductase complex subunit QmoC [Bacteroidales bacterium]